MGRITWDSVAVPNFGNAVDGIRAANEMLNNGFAAARSGVNRVIDDKTAAMSNKAMLDVLAYQDPETLKTALASGSVQGAYDPRFLNKDAIAAISGRQAGLVDQMSKQIGLDTAGMQLEENKVHHADFQKLNSEQGRPIINALRDAYNRKDQAALQRIQTENGDFLSQVPPDTLNAIITSGQGIFGTDQNQNIIGTDFNNRIDDRDVEIATQTLGPELLRLAGDPANFEAYLNANPDFLTNKYGEGKAARVRAAILGQTGGGGSGGAAGVDAIAGGLLSGGGGTGAGGKPLSQVLLGDGQGPNGGNKYGINPPKPIDQMSMGELYDFQVNEMLPKTRAAGVGKINGKVVGSSAAGAFQIVSTNIGAKPESAARQIWGENWRNVPFSLENQDKIAQYLYDRIPVGADLHNTWEGIKPGVKKQANVPWGQVRDQITSVESGGRVGGGANGNYVSPIAKPRDVEYVSKVANQWNLSEDKLLRMAVSFDKNWNSTESADDVARRMTAKGGAFEGDKPNYVASYLRYASKKFGVNNYGILSELFEEAKGDEKGLIGRAFNGWYGASGMTNWIDEDRLKELSGFAKDKESVTRLAKSVNDTSTAIAQASSTTAAVEGIQAAWQAERNRAIQAGRDVGFIDQKYQRQMNAAAPIRDAALMTSVDSASGGPQDTNPVGTNKTPDNQGGGRRDTTTARDRGTANNVLGNLPTARKATAEAQGILKLSGLIRTKKIEEFKSKYGVGPEIAAKDPSKIPAVINEMKSRLQSEAKAAIQKGGVHIALFEAKYGKHPSRYYQ